MENRVITLEEFLDDNKIGASIAEGGKLVVRGDLDLTNVDGDVVGVAFPEELEVRGNFSMAELAMHTPPKFLQVGGDMRFDSVAGMTTSNGNTECINFAVLIVGGKAEFYESGSFNFARVGNHRISAGGGFIFDWCYVRDIDLDAFERGTSIKITSSRVGKLRMHGEFRARVAIRNSTIHCIDDWRRTAGAHGRFLPAQHLDLRVAGSLLKKLPSYTDYIYLSIDKESMEHMRNLHTVKLYHDEIHTFFSQTNNTTYIFSPALDIDKPVSVLEFATDVLASPRYRTDEKTIKPHALRLLDRAIELNKLALKDKKW